MKIPKLTKLKGRHGYFIRIKNPATGGRTWKSLGSDNLRETTEYAKQQILVQSGTQMLREANRLPQTALELLR